MQVFHDSREEKTPQIRSDNRQMQILARSSGTHRHQVFGDSTDESAVRYSVQTVSLRILRGFFSLENHENLHRISGDL